MADIIPHDIKQFLIVNIESIPQLEALLLLRRHQDQRLSSETVAERLYVNPRDASEALHKLVARGLIASEGSGENSVFNIIIRIRLLFRLSIELPTSIPNI